MKTVLFSCICKGFTCEASQNCTICTNFKTCPHPDYARPAALATFTRITNELRNFLIRLFFFPFSHTLNTSLIILEFGQRQSFPCVNHWWFSSLFRNLWSISFLFFFLFDIEIGGNDISTASCRGDSFEGLRTCIEVFWNTARVLFMSYLIGFGAAGVLIGHFCGLF